MFVHTQSLMSSCDYLQTVIFDAPNTLPKPYFLLSGNYLFIQIICGGVVDTWQTYTNQQSYHLSIVHHSMYKNRAIDFTNVVALLQTKFLFHQVHTVLAMPRS